MEYSIKLNAVSNSEKSVKAFATVTIGNCFNITNIAVVENRDNKMFVAMPSYRSNERTEHNEAVYKDVCNPITSEFREKLYGDILSLYDEMEQSGRTFVSNITEEVIEPNFSVRVTPFERDGSNILGLARIVFEDSFVVGNISILKGKEKEFVAMPSCRKHTNKDGKNRYQDICFPVTKDFREKLVDSILECYREERELQVNETRENMIAQSPGKYERTDESMALPFR